MANELDLRPFKVVLTGKVGSMSQDDGGCALIADIDEEATIPDVRLQSWSEEKPPRHTTLEALASKKVRITVEVLESKSWSFNGELCEICGRIGDQCPGHYGEGWQ